MLGGGEKRARYGFGAERRLAKRSDFERLLRQGARRSRGGITLFVAPRHPAAPARLGILITRKHAAKATVRNQIKRCIREAFRLEQGRLGPFDVLVRPPYGARPGPALQHRLRAMLAELGS
ncbi:MAG TPA: ribonuclease P protein component [Burkholderiales bacterium]|nr:ribonuclease P protein component [Burkholderiales bacterium]